MEPDPTDKSSIIRPLTATETAQFLKDYKDIFFKSVDKTKKDTNNENLYEKINNLSYIHNTIDPNCIIRINKRLVRIEYPGEVKNLSKAIETLGGMHCIESSVADHARKLELHFHPENRYNRPSVADKDFKPGILIKVKRSCSSTFETQQSSSNDQSDAKYTYEVEGVSVMNFCFNKLCDFQYLPLVAQQPENKQSKTEYIYEKIIPPKLPSLEWLVREDYKNMDQFLMPVRFSHFDSSRTKLNVENNDKNEPKLKLKGMTNPVSKVTTKQQKNVCRIFGKHRQQISIFVNFKDSDIPTKPLDNALKMLENRNVEEKVERVKQLFKERPIWTKAAIRYNTGLTNEQSKVILPLVAYYFINGPWRISWVKFGYDPRKDPKARIYQTLDYRIRTGESTKLKVSAKRSYTGKTSFLGPTHLKKVSLKDDMSAKPRIELDERCYVLRPLTIPPARQMFYQLCDLILPEIQQMISELPKSVGNFCHPKNGWLPHNFIETCRKVVNDHVLETVQKELLEDKKVMQEKVSKEEVKRKENGSSPLDYCNKMLSNIKKGIYKNVDLRPTSFIPKDIDLGELGENVELISLSSDEENEYTVGEIIKSSIPEKMDEEEDDDADSEISQGSDEAEIDMEIVQEINEMISQANEK